MHYVAIPLGEASARPRPRRMRRLRSLPRATSVPGAEPLSRELRDVVAASIEMRAVALSAHQKRLDRLAEIIRKAKASLAQIQAEFTAELRDTITFEGLDRIIVTVCAQFSVQPEEILGRARPDRIAWPRMVAMALMREKGLSLSQVGARVGGRDHGTVLHAVRAVADRTTSDPKARRDVEMVRCALVALEEAHD